MTGTEAIELFNSRYEFNASQNAPGFTDDEILGLLNDSQYKFISQRAFGNNLYRQGFEGSIKRIDDLEGLVVDSTLVSPTTTAYPNVSKVSLPSDYLHFASCFVKLVHSSLSISSEFPSDIISQDLIKPFIQTHINYPWIEIPKVFIKNGELWIMYDSSDYADVSNVELTYIKDPNPITIAEITWFSESSVREIVRIAIDEAIADAVPEKVQISNDQLNKTE
jgi:hypothetical protein